MILLKGPFCSLATVSSNILVVFAFVVLFLFVRIPVLSNYRARLLWKQVQFLVLRRSRFLICSTREKENRSQLIIRFMWLRCMILRVCINKLWDVLSHWPTGGGGGAWVMCFFAWGRIQTLLMSTWDSGSQLLDNNTNKLQLGKNIHQRVCELFGHHID